MRTLISIITLFVLTSLPISALAMGSHKTQTRNAHSTHSGGQRTAHSVPELDPKAGGAAVILLAGGVLYLVSRRRKPSTEQK